MLLSDTCGRSLSRLPMVVGEQGELLVTILESMLGGGGGVFGGNFCGQRVLGSV